MNTSLLKSLLVLCGLGFAHILSAQNIWTVNSINDLDDGVCNAVHCSLREAIIAANNSIDTDVIAFEIIGNRPFVIVPNTPLPAITGDGTTIDGTTQPDYLLGDIVIQSTVITANNSGLTIAASDVGVFGLKIVGFVENNSAGIEVSGNGFLSNLQIGAPNKGNIVGDNWHGIILRQITNCADVTIQSNYVGVDPSDGMANIGNGIGGISILQGNCTNVLIGGNSNVGEGNIVGFNGGGIGTRVPQTTIQGNFIGTDETGTMNLGNQFSGILLDDLPGEPNNCLVGGDEAGQANTIAFNRSAGIFNNPTAINNRFQQNIIYCNRLGIRFGFTSLDDNRSNQGQLPPIIDCAFQNSISGTAEPNNTIEVFINDNSECTRLQTECQGRQFIGETISDAMGNWQLTANLPTGTAVTATATDATFNTSEFADCITVAGQLIATASNAGPFCMGQQIELIGRINGGVATQFSWTGPNGYTSNEQNPTDARAAGIYQFTAFANGCQVTSTATEVVFLETITQTIGDLPSEVLCPDENIIVNGNRYDINNPNGIEMVSGQEGCDTIVTIALQFYNPSIFQLNQILCAGEQLQINGTRYDVNNPQGSETLLGQANNGCDSIIEINLDFYDVIEENLTRSLCPNSFLTINGTTYDESNPTGIEVFTNGAANGCDSSVQVNLTFSESITRQLEVSLCEGENFEYLGTIYNELNPSGNHLLEGSAANGCDSLVEVNLQFLAPQINRIEGNYCEGDTIEINGQLYHTNRATGIETLAISASNGCDSILDIAFTFQPPIEEQLILNICEGESQIINGTTYNATNLAGQEIFEGASQIGCDSLLSIQVNLLSSSVGFINQSLCTGETLTINGVTYDENNPSGQEILSNAALSGCDSIVEIALQFKPTVSSLLDTLLCSNESLLIAGTRYDENNPTGIELIENENTCEELAIQLTYAPIIAGEIIGRQQLRLGDSITLTLALEGANQFNVLLDIGESAPLLLENISDGHTIIVSPRRQTTYQILTLSAINLPLCETRIGAGLSVVVEQNRAVYFPSAFSPNGDGTNDIFLPMSDEQVEEVLRFRIYDRWGNLVFERSNFSLNDEQAAWDGMYRGQILDNGIYLYVTEIRFNDQAIETFVGDVAIVRE